MLAEILNYQGAIPTLDVGSFSNKTKPIVLRAEYIGDIMDKLTGLGKTIIGTDPDKMWLDQAVKNILV